MKKNSAPGSLMTNESCDVSDLSRPQAGSRRSRDWLAVIFSRMRESLTSPPSLWGFQVWTLVPRAAAATPCLGGLSNQPTNLTSCFSPIGVLGDFVSLLVAKLAHLVRVQRYEVSPLSKQRRGISASPLSYMMCVSGVLFLCGVMVEVFHDFEPHCQALLR